MDSEKKVTNSNVCESVTLFCFCGFIVWEEILTNVKSMVDIRVFVQLINPRNINNICTFQMNVTFEIPEPCPNTQKSRVITRLVKTLVLLFNHTGINLLL